MSGSILIYLFKIIPFSEILSSLKSAEISLVLLGIMLAVPIVCLSAVETQYLMKVQGMFLSVIGIIKINLATNFYGFFLPGALSGGAIKWHKLSKHGSKYNAAAIVVFNRFLEILMILLIGIFCYSQILYISDSHKLFFVFLFLVIVYLLLLNKRTLDHIEIIIRHLLLPRFIKEKAGKFMTSMKQFRKLCLIDHFKIIGLLLLYHGIGIISFYCFAKSLNIDINIWEVGWVRSATSISVMIPLFFAGLGIREGVLVFLLGQYGVLPNDSIALSFLLLLRNLLSLSVGGIFEFKEFVLERNTEEISHAE